MTILRPATAADQVPWNDVFAGMEAKLRRKARKKAEKRARRAGSEGASSKNVAEGKINSRKRGLSRSPLACRWFGLGCFLPVFAPNFQ